jgi:hypothetical protein
MKTSWSYLQMTPDRILTYLASFTVLVFFLWAEYPLGGSLLTAFVGLLLWRFAALRMMSRRQIHIPSAIGLLCVLLSLWAATVTVSGRPGVPAFIGSMLALTVWTYVLGQGIRRGTKMSEDVV